MNLLLLLFSFSFKFNTKTKYMIQKLFKSKCQVQIGSTVNI